MRTVKRKARYFVYIVEASDGTYYTGYTNNLEKRIDLHAKGKGAKYLRGKVPLNLIYAKEYRYLKNAMRGEIKIKKLTRKQKEDLVRDYGKRL